MDEDNFNKQFHERFYLPSASDDGIDTKEYLFKYIEREFPENRNNKNNTVYSVPSCFKKGGEKQATLAEEIVFNRLHGLEDAAASCCQGLWMTFFHSACYAGHSFRNDRVGKLMIREHDFVIFVKYQGKFYMVLIEVKSTHDAKTNIENIIVTSDAKVIKNNKRSAQHQLRDHMEVIEGILGEKTENIIQCYIMWPFLGALTRDPKQTLIRRWKEDKNLHVFEDTLSNQEKFNRWFLDNIINSFICVNEKQFVNLLNRYVILSCGIFVDEIKKEMLALLTQEQLQLLNNDYCELNKGKPLVVHGAAGTGKTLLILKKLQQLHNNGKLNENNRALYICYWPGIRCDVQQKLQQMGINDYVDTARFYISQTGFLFRNNQKYKHVFMDEAEAICLSFEEIIMKKMLSTIFERYHHGNCLNINCKQPYFDFDENEHNCTEWGELWFLVDINQASLFLPKHSPILLKKPTIVLNKVMRSTKYIFQMFKQYYTNPMPLLPKYLLNNMNIPEISIGHHIIGPPIYWVSSEKVNSVKIALINVIIDMCSTKGFKPNDLCIIPFLVNDNFIPESINKEIEKYFVTNGYKPRGVGDVENFIQNKEVNDFLISWALRVKGLEFKVVIMVFDEVDFDSKDFEDRKKTYIIASRCTCMLILVGPNKVKDEIDCCKACKEYPFNLTFENN